MNIMPNNLFLQIYFFAMHCKGRKWTSVIYKMIINNTVFGVCDVNPSSMSAENNRGYCSVCGYLIYKTLLIVSIAAG